MEGVRSRVTGGLLALLALLAIAGPAWSQDSESDREEAVDEVLRDYRDDGVIDACDHTRRGLRDTLEDLPPEADVETPDLRPALEAGIEQIKDDECEEAGDEQGGEERGSTPTATVTPSPPSPPSPPADDSD